MIIARIFARKTSMCPIDNDAYFDEPDLFTPQYDLAMVSVTFTWDIERGYKLMEAWKYHAKEVKIGGVALNGESKEPCKEGLFLKKGVTITSRGCPNKCSFCIVRNNDLIEFNDFPCGNNVADNNILACSDKHQDSVYEMLKKQKGVRFTGGLEARRFTPKVAEIMRGLRIHDLWFACDTRGALKQIKEVSKICKKAGFSQNQMRCYVLIGKDREEEENRLKTIYELGFLPFAQLYQPHEWINYSKEWRRFQRIWARPCITKMHMKQKKGASELYG